MAKKKPNCLTGKPKAAMPNVILVMTSCFLTAMRVGEECGICTNYKTRGTQICESIIRYKVLDRQGCAYHVEVGCENPNHCRNFWTSERISDFEPDDAELPDDNDANDERGWTINRLVCLAGLLTDLRLKKLLKFFSAIGADFLSSRAYRINVEKIARKTTLIATVSKQSASTRLHQIANVCGDTIIKIIAAFDCSWLTRGRKSRHGVVTCVCSETGSILDTEVLSSYCHKCITSMPESVEDEDEDNVGTCGNCDINHKGSSGMMEVTGVQAIFARSITFLKCIIEFMVRDGDSKAYTEIKNIYGAALATVKYYLDKNHSLKCIRKRLESARNGRQIGGVSVKGRGKLTEKFVNQLSTYIAHAVRSVAEKGGTMQDLRTAIWAIFHHKSSSNDAPDHSYCPDGPDTWCGYKRWIQLGKVGSFDHKNVVPRVFMEALRPVFEYITTDDYLEHLLHNHSTSLNESFNSLIWQFCSKSTIKTRQSVQIAVDIATMIWNDGWLSSMSDLYRELNLKVSAQAVSFFSDQDARREKQLQTQKDKTQQQKEQREAERAFRFEMEKAERTEFLRSASRNKRKCADKSLLTKKRKKCADEKQKVKAYEAGAHD